MNNDNASLFAEGLKQLNLTLDPSGQQTLLDFLRFLKKWNKAYNLTAITDLSTMISHHLLDSLSIAPFIAGNNILDVGSGAGFPGIPLAVYFPQKQWTLLDSNGKKIRFLIQAKSELHLSNINIIQARAEQWSSPQRFDTIVTRAVGSIPDLIAKTKQHLRPGGRWLFMTGHSELSELNHWQPKPEIYPLHIPGISAPRYVIIITANN